MYLRESETKLELKGEICCLLCLVFEPECNWIHSVFTCIQWVVSMFICCGVFWKFCVLRFNVVLSLPALFSSALMLRRVMEGICEAIERFMQSLMWLRTPQTAQTDPYGPPQASSEAVFKQFGSTCSWRLKSAIFPSVYSEKPPSSSWTRRVSNWPHVCLMKQILSCLL